MRRERDTEIRRRSSARGRRRRKPHHECHHRDFHHDGHKALPEKDRVGETDETARDGIARGHDFANARLQRAGRRHLQGRRTTQPLGPYAAEAQKAGGGERTIVDAFDAPRHFAGEDRAEDQTEAPVEPRAHQCEYGDHRHGGLWRVRQRGDGSDDAAHRSRCREDMAGDDHQRHLERKGNQVPEAAAPSIHHRERRRVGEADACQDGEGGGDEREDKRVGNPALAPRGERKRNPRQNASGLRIGVSQ